MAHVEIIRKTGSWQRPKKSILSFACLLLLAASLFIPIRGGFTVSTMNVGKVYFSDRMALNHAAINPVFSLMSSLSKSEDFSSQYRFSNWKRPMLFLNLYVAGGLRYILPTACNG